MEHELQDTFSMQEIQTLYTSITNLTKNIIKEDSQFYKDKQLINLVDEKLAQLSIASSSTINTIFWAIKFCKEYGTLPFAGLARAGFIAVQILQSLVTEKFISEEESVAFMNSITSIPNILTQDQAMLTKDEFIAKHGHLRPGTYDIRIESYAEAYDEYFSSQAHNAKTTQKSHSQSQVNNSFVLDGAKLQTIDEYLQSEGFECNTQELFAFMKDAIEYREYGKYQFSKFINHIFYTTRFSPL